MGCCAQMIIIAPSIGWAWRARQEPAQSEEFPVAVITIPSGGISPAQMTGALGLRLFRGVGLFGLFRSGLSGISCAWANPAVNAKQAMISKSATDRLSIVAS